MTQSPQHNEEDQDFNPADGEGDQVHDVPTAKGDLRDLSHEADTQSTKERTKDLLPDSPAGDDGGAPLESNPN